MAFFTRKRVSSRRLEPGTPFVISISKCLTQTVPSGNDQFATGYYLADDLPFSSLLARRFTVCDRWHASILGPTYPNRLYLHSAQSGGYKTNYLPINEGGYGWPTIWEKLTAAGVSAGYYYVDLPVTALFGTRMNSYHRPIDDYFTHCEQGTLPQVTFIDPGFNSGSRTDHGEEQNNGGYNPPLFCSSP